MLSPLPHSGDPKEPVGLEDILATHTLSTPSTRSPGIGNELAAVYSLARVLKDSPGEMIDALLQASLNLCGAGTAGLSVLETTAAGDQIFRWTHVAGMLAKFVGGWTPRNFSPCGISVDRNAAQLLTWPARHFKYLESAVDVPIVQALVIPILMGGQSPGTIWILSHDEAVHFDSEDLRVMTGLAEFAGTTFGLAASARFESAAREKAEVVVSNSKLVERQLRKDQGTLEELLELRTAELGKLSAQLFTSQDEERRRIAREMHDSTGQKIAVLKMDLTRVQTRLKGDEGIAGCLSLATEISNEIRTLSYLLHPPMLDEFGLVSAVQVYVAGINRRKVLHVKLEVDTPPGRLSPDIEIALFRVVQAALSNTQVHSGSKSATIRIARDPEKVILEIVDQGRGFRQQNVGDDATRIAGVGLVGIKERLQLIGGKLEIETSRQGTVLRSVVPLSSPISLPS